MDEQYTYEVQGLDPDSPEEVKWITLYRTNDPVEAVDYGLACDWNGPTRCTEHGQPFATAF
jgi:hypothetical protein